MAEWKESVGFKFYFTSLIIVLDIVTPLQSQAQGWTIWYNVDRPYHTGDDETYENIRNHDFTICGNLLPVKALCRVADDGLVFTESDWRNKTVDILALPCTPSGLQCRNEDQNENRRCQNYEIRFFCPHTGDDQEEGRSTINYGVIALASGLSVLLPLLCVCVIQCVKQARIKRHNERQRLARQIMEQIPSSEINSETFRGPPTYESLFGGDNSVRSEQNVRQQSLGQDNAGFVNENGTQNSSRGIFQISGQLLPEESTSNLTSNNIYQQSQSPRRFPGMHLSITDIIAQNENDLSTPPPTYGDAMKIIGEIPPKYSDIENVS